MSMKNKTEARIWTLHLLDRYYVDGAVCDTKNTVIVIPKKDADQREAEWIDIINRISLSQFCTGTNNRSWRATFDWLLQPDTALKVLEGKFDDSLKNKKEDMFSMIDFGGDAS